MRTIDSDKVIELISDVQKEYPITDRREIARAMRVALFDIRRMIEEQPTISQWIPVSERLPEVGEDVLTYGRFGEQEILALYEVTSDDVFWLDENGYGCELEYVLAWMPLPEPFKESEEE